MSEKLFWASHQEIMELVECPICLNTMYPPIYQCSNGHNICSKCKPKVVGRRCPTCKVVDKDDLIRSLPLEKFLAFTRLHCSHHIAGCEKLVPYEEKQEHEKNQCKYRPIHCPFSQSDCKFMGSIFKLVDHIENWHEVQKVETYGNFIFEVSRENLFKKRNGSRILGVCRTFIPHRRLFLVQLESFDKGGFEFYMLYLTLIGDEVEAKQCICHLYIKNGATHNSMISWEGIPCCLLNTSNADIIESGNGLLLCKSTAQNFMDVIGTLQIQVHLPSDSPKARILVGAVATTDASAWAVIALAADGHFLGSWAGYEKPMGQFRAKCFALMKATEVCLDQKWSSVLICSDSRQAIELLNSTVAIAALKDEEGDFLRWVKEKMEQNFIHIFSYIGIGLNPLPDSLAKYTITMKKNLVCMDPMGPKCISHLITKT